MHTYTKIIFYGTLTHNFERRKFWDIFGVCFCETHLVCLSYVCMRVYKCINTFSLLYVWSVLPVFIVSVSYEDLSVMFSVVLYTFI